MNKLSRRIIVIGIGALFLIAFVILFLMLGQDGASRMGMGQADLTRDALEATETYAPYIAQSVDFEAETVQIINRSGDVIGSATLRVYYPESIQQGGAAAVELELNLMDRFITPTPMQRMTPTAEAGDAGEAPTMVFPTEEPGMVVIPPPDLPTAPPAGIATATPRAPQFESNEQNVYQLMGASLYCVNFIGCDEEANPNTVRVIGLSGTRWTWILSPEEAAQGAQSLRVELWRLISINDGQARPDTVWEHTFSINVTGGGGAEQSSTLVTILIALIVVGAAVPLTAFLWNKRPRHRPSVFISYRRKVSWATALKIHDMLTARGADVFMDVQDLREGRYAQKLEDEIRSREYFVLLIAPGTFESEWVVKEAQMAIDAGKNIIPVLTDGFDLYQHQAEIPPQLKDLSSHNAVTLSLEYFDAGIDRLAEFIGLK